MQYLRVIFATLAMVWVAAPSLSAAQDPAMKLSEEEMVDDFAFIYGNWKINHKRLNARLAGATEWTEFETDYDAWPLVKGKVNADRAYGDFGGGYFEGASLRTFDPKAGEWTIYWMDMNNPAVTEQVRGRFDDAVGTFYGEEEFNGRRVKLRFIWKKVDADNAYWDQAYQDPDSGEWEVNWIMEFRRKK